LSTPANARKRACAACVAGLASDGRRATAFALPRFVPGAVTTLLSVLHGAHSVGAGVFGFLTTREANALRLVNHECREAVAAARWHDAETRITGSLAAWRACFPGALAANVDGRRDLRDADFEHLAGVKVLNMGYCTGITGAGLAHLAGIRELNATFCRGITNAGRAFWPGLSVRPKQSPQTRTLTPNPWRWGKRRTQPLNQTVAHLAGIRKLSIERCVRITDAGLAHLAGIRSLDMRYCPRITDSGLAHLTGIHALDMVGCTDITDAGLAYLAGINSLDMSACTLITDTGLARLAGIHTLSMRGCFRVTKAGIARLKGVQTLHVSGCAPDAIAAARALGLSV
jgi:hypothetical protein